MIAALSFVLLIIQGSAGQSVKVEPEVVSYPGQTVNLRCSFPNPESTELSQVSWILEQAKAERINVAVFHPTFGVNYPASPVKGRVKFALETPNLQNPSIQITDVQMTDEGRYICEYATYPSGNEQGVTALVMLAKPSNSAKTLTVVAGSAPVVVARCISANGQPPASITWVTTVNGNGTVPVKTTNPDKTVTVQSEYKLVPTAADNGKDVSCVVAHRTLEKPESFPMKLTIEFIPVVNIIGYDDNWYVGRTNAILTCQATGNPFPTTVTWTSLTGVIPPTVQIKENKLMVLKVDETVNTTFICEVKNRLGTGKAQVTVTSEPPAIHSNGAVVAGVVIGSILALLLVGALIGVLVMRSRRQQLQGYRGNGKSHGGAAYDIKSRLFGSKAAKNGTNGGGPANNNGPIYTYQEDAEAGPQDKANHGLHHGGVALLPPTTPTAQDILLSGEMDEAERRKFDELEEEEERYDHFGTGGPILQLRPPNHEEDLTGGYLDDDMESQRDGSVISRTAVYV